MEADSARDNGFGVWDMIAERNGAARRTDELYISQPEGLAGTWRLECNKIIRSTKHHLACWLPFSNP